MFLCKLAFVNRLEKSKFLGLYKKLIFARGNVNCNEKLVIFTFINACTTTRKFPTLQ